jgi:hypothetical protein
VPHRIPLDHPTVLALARARQQLAHDYTHLPTWDELTDEEQNAGLPDARNYLQSAINAGLISEAFTPDSSLRERLAVIVADELPEPSPVLVGRLADLINEARIRARQEAQHGRGHRR